MIDNLNDVELLYLYTDPAKFTIFAKENNILEDELFNKLQTKICERFVDFVNPQEGPGEDEWDMWPDWPW